MKIIGGWVNDVQDINILHAKSLKHKCVTSFGSDPVQLFYESDEKVEELKKIQRDQSKQLQNREGVFNDLIEFEVDEDDI